MSFLTKIFGDDNTRSLKKYEALVPVINSFEPEMEGLSDEALKAKTPYFKERLQKGESLDDILPEAFAVVRETSKRLLGERHYDVQLIGGAIIHDGNISEMRTGEGKTLVGTLPVYLNALNGKGVHVVTVNDYLSRRDAVWMGQIYAFHGLSVGIVGQQASYLYDPNHQDKDEERDEEGSYKVIYEFLRPVDRTDSYQADITYGTNSEFGFDYLRDNIEYSPKKIRQRGHAFAVIDEIDSILIDEARTPLIISAPTQDGENLYTLFSQIVKSFKETEDYEVDEKLKAITLTDAGIEKAEKMLNIGNIYTEMGIKYVHHLETAVRAKALFHKDKQYVVKDGEITIVDEFTGRLQPGRRWSEGLHQAIESKEGLAIQQETRTFASITYQNYFRMYEKLSGMTGTASTSSEEFYKVYRLQTITVPTHKEIKRIDQNDLIFRNENGKFTALARIVKDIHQTGQPVLIGTVSIEKNEHLSSFLKKEGIPHQVLNAKNHENEGEIIAQAGKKGAVTIATNMAGRGVDIKLGGVPFDKEKYEEVKSLGGLFVIGTERHDARRIDNQLRGRSGRQGDPGKTQFYVSLEDPLMRIFASDTIKSVMGRIGLAEDQPIENRLITRSLESAQTKIEGFNFDSRKHVLDYDNVLNIQRTAIYNKRKIFLTGTDGDVEKEIEKLADINSDIVNIISKKRKELGNEEFFKVIRRLFLQSIDTFWVDHLETMDYLRSSVSLRAIGQRDPLIEYKREGLQLYNNLLQSVDSKVVEMIPALGEGAFKQEEERLKKTIKDAKLVSSGSESKSTTQQPGKKEEKIGRNDLVTIVKDGKEETMKFKKAESLLEDGWELKR